MLLHGLKTYLKHYNRLIPAIPGDPDLSLILLIDGLDDIRWLADAICVKTYELVGDFQHLCDPLFMLLFDFIYRLLMEQQTAVRFSLDTNLCNCACYCSQYLLLHKRK